MLNTHQRLLVLKSTATKQSQHRPPGFALVLLILLVACTSISVQAATGIAATPQKLRSVQQIRHLPAEAFNRPLEVHIHAVVTYYDRVAPNLFVQDETGGIWVDLRGVAAPPPQPGQLLDLHGLAAAGFTPYIAKPRWTVLGST